MKIRAQSGVWRHDVEILIVEQWQDGQAVAKPLEFEVVKEGHRIEPTIRITTREAQQLMDDLWQCGLRPSEGTGSAGALKATQNHLQDMRRLVFEPSMESVEIREAK